MVECTIGESAVDGRGVTRGESWVFTRGKENLPGTLWYLPRLRVTCRRGRLFRMRDNILGRGVGWLVNGGNQHPDSYETLVKVFLPCIYLSCRRFRISRVAVGKQLEFAKAACLRQ